MSLYAKEIIAWKPCRVRKLLFLVDRYTFFFIFYYLFIRDYPYKLGLISTGPMWTVGPSSCCYLQYLTYWSPVSKIAILRIFMVKLQYQTSPEDDAAKGPCNCIASQSWGSLEEAICYHAECPDPMCFSNFLRIPPQAAYLIDRLTVLHVSNNFITCNTFFLIFISMSLCNVKVQCKVLHLLFVYVFYFIFFVKLPLPILLMQGNLAFGFHSCCNSDAKLLTQLAKIFWALVSFAKKKKLYHHSLSTYKYTTWNKPF